jgi:hypothetical protein
MTPGNLVHRRSSFPVFGAIIGHAGIVVGPNRIIDCSTDRGRKAVKEISFAEFEAGETFYGERELPGATQQQKSRIVARAKEIAGWATEYDGAHNNQKGRWFNEGTNDAYWEADCVGLCEHCYEFVGLNIVSDEGVLLTVPEQRDAMRVVSALRITPEGRAQLFASYLTGTLGEYELRAFYQEFPSDRLQQVSINAALDRGHNESTSRRLTNCARELGLLLDSEANEVLQMLTL